MSKILKKLSVVLLIAVNLQLVSCSVTPVVNDPTVASFDGNHANSGIIQYLDNGSLEITSGARDRYNSLIEKFSKRFLPKIKVDFGITAMNNGNYSLTKQGADHWYHMLIMLDRDRINKAK